MSTETAERRQYIKGFLLAIGLTVLSFLLVIYTSLPTSIVYGWVAVLAVVQIVIHFRYFLHIDLNKQKREDLYLILFSSLLLVIMIGGTLWILTDLSHRMH